MYSKLIIFLFVLIQISTIKGDNEKTSNTTSSLSNSLSNSLKDSLKTTKERTSQSESTLTDDHHDLSKQESKQTIKQISIKNGNQPNLINQNENTQRAKVDKTIDNVDKQYKEKGKIKIGLAKSNFGIRVIKSPTLESLISDGQRLKELNSKLRLRKVPENTENKEQMKASLSKHSSSKLQKDDKKAEIKHNFVVKTVLPVYDSVNNRPNGPGLHTGLPKQYLNYQYDHHIEHTNLNRNPLDFETRNYHNYVNEKIQKTKDNMKLNLIHHHHHRVKPHLDQINMEPLKVHLNPYLKNKHHRPNINHGNPKFPLSKQINQAAYNRKQGPDLFLVKKQAEYRRNPYPHLNRFRNLVKPNPKPKNAKNSKLDHYDNQEDDKSFDDFDKDFEKGEKNSRSFGSMNPMFGLANLDQLPSLDFRSLAPVYVKNIDYDTFYKLNPYFTLPLPQYK